MPRARIIATGRHVPDRIVTNEDLTQWMDTSDEWIRQRTGIEERRWVPEGQGIGASDLAVEATKKALDKAGMTVEDIDAIVFATLSPDHMFPGTGCFLQRKLGIPGVPALDVRNQCSGFLYGLAVADAWIQTGLYRHVLLVGAEVHSTGLDVSTEGRDVSVIFGDGAGVALLGPSEDEETGVLSIHLGADGRYAEDLWVEFPSSKHHPQYSAEIMAERRQYPKMQGQKVFKHAVAKMPRAVQAVCKAAGVAPQEIDLFIPHQANLRINEFVQQTLGLGDDQVFNNIQRYGNTTAATIPIAIDEAEEMGRLKRGDLLALAAFGAGFTWGGALLRY
ncbi:MAG: ketoacyl-ACP synthase III [Deltaproteobacteria bacterium]|nr:MAG: ketoacyl-ACP synthase III [Deltaproteobacteria bacterium]